VRVSALPEEASRTDPQLHSTSLEEQRMMVRAVLVEFGVVCMVWVLEATVHLMAVAAEVGHKYYRLAMPNRAAVVVETDKAAVARH